MVKVLFRIQKKEDLHSSASNSVSVESKSSHSSGSSGSAESGGFSSSSMNGNFNFDPEIEESLGKQLLVRQY